MTRYTLYPGFIKLNYEVDSKRHKQIIPVRPYLALTQEYWLSYKGSQTGALWTIGLAAYVNVMKAFLNNGQGDIVDAELWTLSEPGADPVWQASETLNVAGTSATAALAYGQQTITFRTAAGGIYRNYVMQPSIAQNVRTSGADLVTTWDAFRDYMVGSDSIVCGRDGSFLSTAIFLTSKVNDKLRKKYLLDL